jgi:aspartyl aminopeptidase
MGSMLKKISGGSKVVNIFSSFGREQMNRDHPSFDDLSTEKREKALKFSREYAGFLNVHRTPWEVVRGVEEILDSSDKNGWTLLKTLDSTAFALINPGERSVRDGITVIYTHTDSPCLRTKVNPNGFNWDPEGTFLNTGYELEVFAHGGISSYQWTGRQIELIGWTVKKGKRRDLNRILTYSPDISPHTDQRSEEGTLFRDAHKEEDINLITGERNEKDFLKKLGLSDQSDFSKSVILGVPTDQCMQLGKDYLTGYGHDDKSCVYASVIAALNTRPAYPSIVIGFDKEEIGSDGPGGANGKFFELAFNELLYKQSFGKKNSLDERTRLGMYRRSLAIDGDVDVGANSREIERIDQRNVAKFGFGTIIYASDSTSTSDQLSPRVVEYVHNAIRGVVQQTIGSPLPADKAHHIGTMNEFMVRRGFPTINIGVPIGSMHAPTELVNIGDLYQTYLAYSKILSCEKNRLFDI